MAKHNVELIEQLRQSLVNRPPPAMKSTALSAQKIVASLTDEVRALQEQGYTYAMIAAILSASGLRISGGTLCTYMSRIKNPTSRKTKGPVRSAPKVDSLGAQGQASEYGKHASPIGSVIQSSARFTPAPDTEDI